MKRRKREVRSDFDANRKAVCALLRRHCGLSRQQLSDMTGLHRSTISKVITDYLNQGVVTEEGKIERKQKQVGKKQVLVRIRNEVGWSLGIGLRRGHADLMVLGASGAIVRSSALDFDCALDEIPVHLARHVDAWFAREGKPPGVFAGVGIGIRGSVDSSTGHVLYWPEYSAQRYPLVEDWSKHFSAPLFVFDSTRSASACEILNPIRPEHETFLYVHLDCRPTRDGFEIAGTESGIVLQGAVYAGARGHAGRFLGKLNHEAAGCVGANELKTLEKKDADMTPALDALATQLAELISSAAGLLDMDHIILGGHVVPQNEDFLHAVNTRVRRALDAGDGTPTTKVRPSRFQSPTTAHCAGLMAFDHSPVGCRIRTAS